MFDLILDCWGKIPRVILHYFAFMRTQRKLLGKYVYWGHDLDKLFLYLVFPFLGYRVIKKVHRAWNKHHVTKDKDVSKVDYIHAMIDWECCRLTKPNEPMTAREYLESARNKLGEVHYCNMNEVLTKFNL